jgi:ubiquinone/menaquinone biosynthesis C-methylase UbiE
VRSGIGYYSGLRTQGAPSQDVGVGRLPVDGRDVPAAARPTLVEACGITPGVRVLDVAAGTGNASIPAAKTGAEVTASDPTPELFEAGRQRAQAEGVELAWVEADAESLPFRTGHTMS